MTLKYDPLEVAVLRWLKTEEMQDVMAWNDFYESIDQEVSCTPSQLRHCMKMMGIEGLVEYKYIPSIPRVECSITREGLLALRTM